MKKGEAVPNHSAPSEIVVVCRKGVVKFLVEAKMNTLNENHSLEAVKDCELFVIKLKKFKTVLS